MPNFTSGTFVTTLRGETPVEDLAEGDRIITRDHGLQTLKSIVRQDIDYANLVARPHLQPVLILAGALGHGLPERDMLVSPNLRLIAVDDAVVFGTAGRDGLVAAKTMVNSRTVRPCTVLGVSYFHLGFDGHETILANGGWFEAFHPTDTSLGSEGNAQRTELFDIHPALRPTKPVTPTGRGRYRQLADRHYGN